MKNIIFCFIIILINFHELKSKSELTKFLIEQQYNKKLIVCAFNPSECRGCIIPLDEFFLKIKSINHNIETLIFIKDSLTRVEQKLFFALLKLDTNDNFKLIVNSKVHQELYEMEEGPMVGIADKARLISHYNLKDENLTDFFKDITPELKISLLNNIKLNNNIINPKDNGIASVVHIGNSVFLQTWNFNCISKYSANGTLVKILFFDSLKLDYETLCKVVLSKKDYEKNKLHFEKRGKKENGLINLVTTIKYSNDQLALCCTIKYYYDSLYNNIPVSFVNESNFLVIVDSNLTYQKTIPIVAHGVSFSEHGVQINNKFYFARYDMVKEKKYLCEFVEINGKLEKSDELPLPYSDTDDIETICPLISDSNLIITVAYPFFTGKKPLKFELYEVDFKQKKTNLVFKIKKAYIHGPWVQKTRKNNYIFYKDRLICGYDRVHKKIIQLSNNTDFKYTNANYYSFFENGNWLQVICEE